jgi:hypothetical protein
MPPTISGPNRFNLARNYYAAATLWMGLLLIFLNVYANGGWSNLWSIITTPATSAPQH